MDAPFVQKISQSGKIVSYSTTRNNFYHYLAGGVSGLSYFMYSVRTKSSWTEIRHLGQVLHRIGPVQVAIKPAHRDIGMLNSFTSNCFDPGHTLTQVYGFHNLMQAHFSVEMVDEEEMVDGLASNYKAILLYDVNYLRQSVYDALAKYPAEITEMKLSARTTASANQPVHVVVNVMGGNKLLAGVVPVEFIWRDPNGKKSIMSGVRAAKNGETTFDWSPAINDPTGTWTLEVKELASGKTAQVEIDLAK